MSYIHNAKFICAPSDWGLHCPEFKRAIEVVGEVERAVLEISALGVYECRINGERGTDGLHPDLAHRPPARAFGVKGRRSSRR